MIWYVCRNSLFVKVILHAFFKGVALSVTTLVLALAQSFPVEYSGCYEKAVDRLKRVGVNSTSLQQVVLN